MYIKSIYSCYKAHWNHLYLVRIIRLGITVFLLALPYSIKSSQAQLYPNNTANTANTPNNINALKPTSSPSKIAVEAHVVHKKKDGTPQFTNALIHSKSTYLRQHAHQPIHWQAWEPKVLQKAKQEKKMIFLSVGYATCHWCHVMARESFEDLEIARLMNQHWIAIKVDRQELPHIDDIYMRALRKIGGRGGWPMTLVLTPDAHPFFAATYLPPRTGYRGRRQGLLTVLQDILVRYKKSPQTVLAEAKKITQQMQQSRSWFQQRIPQASSLVQSAQSFANRFDRTWGGFGKAPKFPRPVSLRFLLGYARRTQDDFAHYMVSHTLNKMRSGGVWDHVGGGFHRYSVDRTWHIPHFEKMLYDQSQLVLTYLEAWQSIEESNTHVDTYERAQWRKVITQTLDYLRREMQHPLGGFYAATDADSLSDDGEEEEGFFFTWTLQELNALLAPQDAQWWYQYYTMHRNHLEGRSVLRTLVSDQEMAKQIKAPLLQLQTSLDRSRPILYKARQKRHAPMLDEQVISAWNGLLLSAFVRSSSILQRPQDLKTARDMAEMITQQMMETDGYLWRIYAQNQKITAGGLNDYAACVGGLLDLFMVTSEVKWLTYAQLLQQKQDQLLWNPRKHTYRLYSADQTLDLMSTPQADGDYAMPAGISIATHNLLRWFDLTSNIAYEKKLKSIFQSHATLLQRAGSSWPYLSHALNLYLDQRKQIILVTPTQKLAQSMSKMITQRYLPHVTVITVTSSQHASLQTALPSLLKDKPMLDSKVTFYLCENSTCRAPSTSLSTLKKALNEVSPLTQVIPQSLYEIAPYR
jgi:uncharacterized protein